MISTESLTVHAVKQSTGRTNEDTLLGRAVCSAVAMYVPDDCACAVFPGISDCTTICLAAACNYLIG